VDHAPLPLAIFAVFLLTGCIPEGNSIGRLEATWGVWGSRTAGSRSPCDRH